MNKIDYNSLERVIRKKVKELLLERFQGEFGVGSGYRYLDVYYTEHHFSGKMFVVEVISNNKKEFFRYYVDGSQSNSEVSKQLTDLIMALIVKFDVEWLFPF